MAVRVAVILAFLALLAAPFVFRPSRPPPPPGAARLIVITPHNEQIRTEFQRAFEAWYEREHRERVVVEYRVPGGTSEIRKMLEAQYTAAFEAGEAPGGGADLVFGGGSYEHDRLRRGVVVSAGGGRRAEAISAPVDFPQERFDEWYGENAVGDGRLYDPDRHWFGLALSSFGIVFNRDALSLAGVPAPREWEDLCHPGLRGWVALVNPGQSGSITTAFEAILHHRGWAEGWRILRRAAANARYFSGSSLKPPTDVGQGNAAAGVCIDFYGRAEAQAIRLAGGGDRIGYVEPAGTMIDADPISMLRGAPSPVLAGRFIEFCLSEEGQALWQFRIDDPAPDGMGPERFELRRLPVRRAMYERHLERMIDRVRPFDLARSAEHADPEVRAFIAILFTAMAMDCHDELRAAWSAIVDHPAYPAGGGIVRAADVEDPRLRRMLELFDAMPEIAAPPGPGGAPGRLSLETTGHLGQIRAGWLAGEWKGARLWPPEAAPRDEMRRRFAASFRANYRSIVEVGRGAPLEPFTPPST